MQPNKVGTAMNNRPDMRRLAMSTPSMITRHTNTLYTLIPHMSMTRMNMQDMDMGMGMDTRHRPPGTLPDKRRPSSLRPNGVPPFPIWAG